MSRSLFGKKLQKQLAQHLKDNFYITTSGNFHTPTLNVIAEIGVDRAVFAIDYPYERTAQAVEWFDNCAIRRKTARRSVGSMRSGCSRKRMTSNLKSNLCFPHVGITSIMREPSWMKRAASCP